MKYQIFTAVSLLLFYIVYRLTLKSLTFHRLNRVYLVLAVGFSLVLPVVPFGNFVGNVGNFSILLDTITVTPNGAATASHQNFFSAIPVSSYFYFAYISVFMALTLKFILSIVHIFLLVKRSTKVNYHGYSLVINNRAVNPFSFLNFIFINKETITKENFEKILAHELTHVRQRHSYDLILLELICIIQWFNPVVWMYKRAVKETHEYLADEAATEKDDDIAKYQMLLLQQSLGGNIVSLASNFNYSLLKNRIKMLTKTKSKGAAKFRILFAVPVILLVVLAISCTKTEKNQIAQQTENQMPPPPPPPINEQENQMPPPPPPPTSNDTKKLENPDASGVFIFIEEMPEYPGGELELRKFIAENVKYPDNAREKGIQGKVYVKFAIMEDGSVDKVSIYRSVSNELNAEAIRVIKLLPKWTPGKNKGKPVAVWYIVPINFVLQ